MREGDPLPIHRHDVGDDSGLAGQYPLDDPCPDRPGQKGRIPKRAQEAPERGIHPGPRGRRNPGACRRDPSGQKQTAQYRCGDRPPHRKGGDPQAAARLAGNGRWAVRRACPRFRFRQRGGSLQRALCLPGLRRQHSGACPPDVLLQQPLRGLSGLQRAGHTDVFRRGAGCSRRRDVHSRRGDRSVVGTPFPPLLPDDRCAGRALSFRHQHAFREIARGDPKCPASRFGPGGDSLLCRPGRPSVFLHPAVRGRSQPARPALQGDDVPPCPHGSVALHQPPGVSDLSGRPIEEGDPLGHRRRQEHLRSLRSSDSRLSGFYHGDSSFPAGDPGDRAHHEGDPPAAAVPARRRHGLSEPGALIGEPLRGGRAENPSGHADRIGAGGRPLYPR